MRFRPRYFVALLWHWSIPFFLGVAAASLSVVTAETQVLIELEQVFTRSIQAACSQPGQPAQIKPL